MIENQEQLLLSQVQLKKMKSWEERIVNDLELDYRLKKSELTGIGGMISQIENEIRLYNLTCLQDTLDDLEQQAHGIGVEQIPALLQRTIQVMRELTNAIQPVQTK